MLVILLTLNKSDLRQNLSSNITDFKQHSQATFGRLLLTVQHMYDLRMPCHALVTKYFPPPFTESATDLREHFLLSGIFYLALFPAGFEASLGLTVQPQS